MIAGGNQVSPQKMETTFLPQFWCIRQFVYLEAWQTFRVAFVRISQASSDYILGWILVSIDMRCCAVYIVPLDLVLRQGIIPLHMIWASINLPLTNFILDWLYISIVVRYCPVYFTTAYFILRQITQPFRVVCRAVEIRHIAFSGRCADLLVMYNRNYGYLPVYWFILTYKPLNTSQYFHNFFLTKYIAKILFWRGILLNLSKAYGPVKNGLQRLLVPGRSRSLFTIHSFIDSIQKLRYGVPSTLFYWNSIFVRRREVTVDCL